MRRRGLTASGALGALVVAALGGAVGASAQQGAPETPASEAAEATESAAPAEGDAAAAPPGGEPGLDEPARALEKAPRKTEGIEEIVVKGRGYESLEQETISVTTFGATDIQELRIQNIADLADYTPNLEINTAFAASNPTLFIRGIGLKDYNANAAGAVAVYQDDIYINSPAGQLFQMFDIESVQVLRGPQGTTHGRNATAGAILVNSFKPDGEWSATGSFTYGNYNTIEAEGALGFPLMEDMLWGRVAFTANFADGYVDNDCAGQSLPSVIDLSTGLLAPPGGILPPCFGKQFPPFEQEVIKALDGKDVFVNKKADPGLFLVDGEIVELDCDPTIRQIRPGPQPDPPPCPNVPRTFNLKNKQNDTKNWATRGLLRFQPTDTQDWLFNFHWGQNRSDSFHLVACGQRSAKQNDVLGIPRLEEFDAIVNCNGATENGFQRPPNADAWTGFYDLDGKEHLDTLGTSLTGSFDFGPVVLVTISGYEENQRKVDDEGDATPASLFAATWKDEAWQVSQELRAEGAGDRYTWVVGGYFLHEELTADNFFIDATQTDFQQLFDQTLWNFAPFASFRYDFFSQDSERPGLDGLSLEAGLRYNWEKKDFTLSTDIFTRNVKRELQFRGKETVGDTWTGVTGDFTLSYAPVESLTTYAKYSRGMKGGHFNAGATSKAQIIDPVDPEFIHAAELGAKGAFFDGRLQFSAAGFRYWYTDLQVFDIVNELNRAPTQQLLNSDANVWGAELEFQAVPLPGLFVRGAVGWLDSEFEDFQVRKRVRGPPTGPGTSGCGQFCAQDAKFNYSGNPLIAAPEWTVSGMVEYELALPGNRGALVPQFNFSWRSEHFTDPSKAEFTLGCVGGKDCPLAKLNEGILSQPAYWLLNARLAYRWSGFEIAGWVQNLTDEAYLIDSFDLRQNLGLTLQVYGRPRTYGLTLSHTF